MVYSIIETCLASLRPSPRQPSRRTPCNRPSEPPLTSVPSPSPARGSLARSSPRRTRSDRPAPRAPPATILPPVAIVSTPPRSLSHAPSSPCRPPVPAPENSCQILALLCLLSSATEVSCRKDVWAIHHSFRGTS